MAEVTGRIGDNDVSLDNAATETTLRALLLATTKSTKEMDKLLKLAAKSGMNPKDIEAANAAVRQQAAAATSNSQATSSVTKGLVGLNKSFAVIGGVVGSLTSSAIKTADNLTSLAGQLMNGQASVTGFANAFKDLPLGLGTLASIIGKVIALQEEELESYRKLTNAGVNFAGGLTELRLSATSLGLSLDQFTGLIASNSETLVKFGVTADDGARNFVKIAQTLKNSPFGEQLMSLGFGFEQLNQGVMSYLKVSGGASASQIKDTKAMAESASEYIKQQDMLARLTGKSVEAQQKLLEEESANAAWENFLSSITDPREKERLVASFNAALAQGGKDFGNVVRGMAMKTGPLTRGAQEFQGMMGNTTAAAQRMLDAARSTSTSTEEFNKTILGTTVALAKDGQMLGNQLAAVLIEGSGGIATAATAGMKASTRLRELDLDSAEGQAKFLAEITRERSEQEKSQAAKLAEMQNNLNKLGASLQEALSPLLKAITPAMSGLLNTFADLVDSSLPDIKKGIQTFANWINQFVSNIFTSEGRDKIVNDIKFFFEDLMVEIKKSVGIISQAEADQAKKEIAANRQVSDAKAAAALAMKAASAPLPKGAGIQEGETVEAARQRLQAEQDAKQKRLAEAEAAVAAAQAKRDSTVIDVSTPEQVAKLEAATMANMSISGKIWTNLNRAGEAMWKGFDKIAGTGIGEYYEKKRVKANVANQRAYGLKVAENETAPVTPSEQLDYSQVLPGMSEGGIARGPDTGYLALLHGTEAVIPLGNSNPTKENLPDILLKALSEIGQSASKMLEVPEPLKDLIKKNTETEIKPVQETEASKSVIESSKQLENVTELLVKLNIQTAEMLEHVKISAEFDRRNLDALNGLNPNAFIRA